MAHDEDISRIQGAHELGLAFVRSCILLNGGAFAIVLGYMAGATETSLVKFSLFGLQIAMSCFLVSIFLTLFTLGLSYIYTALNFQSRFREWLDTKLIPTNAFCCLAALLLFSGGVATLIATASMT